MHRASKNISTRLCSSCEFTAGRRRSVMPFIFNMSSYCEHTDVLKVITTLPIKLLGDTTALRSRMRNGAENYRWRVFSSVPLAPLSK